MRSSKSTWVWPGAPMGRFQSWCGSMSSGRTTFGSVVFFGLAIDYFPGRLFAEREVCHATAPAAHHGALRDERRPASVRSRRIKVARSSRSPLIGFDPCLLDNSCLPLAHLFDHRLEIRHRHAQEVHADLDKLFAPIRLV